MKNTRIFVYLDHNTSTRDQVTCLKTFLKLLVFQAFVGLLLVISHMPASAQDLELTEAEQTWLTEHPTLRIAPDPDFPPLEFFDEQGRYQGLVADYMHLVAERLGVRVEAIRTDNWAQSLDALRSGEADLIGAMAPIDEFRKEFLFSATYFGFYDAIITSEGVKGQVRLEDLGGKQVLVVADWPAVQFLRNQYPDVIPVEVESTLEGLMKVAFKEYDYVIAYLPTASYIIREHALAGLQVAGLVGEISSGAAMVRNDSEILRGLIDKALASITEKERHSIENRWLPDLSAPEIITATELKLSEAEQTWIEEHPVIRVHNEMNWPPFNFNENGKPRGYSIDFMNLIAAKVGLQAEYISGPSWNQFLEMIRTGELDVMANIVPTDARREYMQFTSAFYDQPVAVVVEDSTTGINSLEDLHGRRVAVVEGFFQQKYMERQYPEAELVLAKDVLDCLYAVVEGRADAMVAAFPSTKYLMDQHALIGLRVAVISRDPELMSSNALGVRKDWPVLRDILQKGMDSLDQEELTALRQKWLGPTQEPETQDSLSNTIFWLFGITLGIFLVLIVLNRVSSHYSRGEDVGLQTGTLRFRVLILGALSVFVALVGTLGWLALDHVKGKILRDAGNNLENVLITTAQRLEIWVDQQANVLSQIAKNPILIRQTELLLNVAADPESLLRSAELAEIRASLGQYPDTLGLGFFIINPEGLSIASSRDSNIGTKNLIAIQRPELLDRVFQGESVFVPPIYSDVAIGNESHASSRSLFVAVPIRGDGGGVIAALTMRLDPKHGFSRVLQLSRVGESGESYAFDRHGTLLSASRFEDELREIGLLDVGQSSVMNIQIRDPGGNITQGFRSDIPRAEQPFTHMAHSAIANISLSDTVIGARSEQHAAVQKGMQGYRDYRGVPVFGAWLWDENHGLGLTSEIDVAEALSTFTIIRTLSLAVFGITMILSLGGALFILATGERTNRVLRKARDELEDRVERRTRDLNTAKERFSTLVEHIPGAVFRFGLGEDTTGNIHSEYYLTLTGYPAEDFMSGKVQFVDLIHPDDQEWVVQEVQQSIATREPYQHEYRIIDRAGKTRWLSSRGIAVYDSDGNPEFVDGTMFDVTEQKQAEDQMAAAHNELERTVERLESVNSVIMRVSPDGLIIGLNSFGQDLFGFSESEVVGQPMLGTIVADKLERADAIRSLLAGILDNPRRFMVAETTYLRKDGSEIWMLWRNKPIRGEDGKLLEVLSTGIDISDRKRMETELAVAKAAADAANAAKGDFLANMSHEIRTPMNAIIGLSDLCLRTELTEKQQDYLSKIHVSSHSLLGIINDILDFSKIEAGKLDIESIEFDIDEVLHKLATVATVKTQEKGLELLFLRDPEVPTALVGDPLRLGQILINLTNNAVKFTERGEILVSVCKHERNDSGIVLDVSVRDTGIGMSAEQQGKLFKSFSQADTSTTRKYGGTGLGLAISKQLVELMGGEIGVDSEPGVGTTFRFTVRMGIGEGAETQSFETVPDLRGRHAVVVDDNPTAREILSTYLASYSFNVRQAASAQELFALLRDAQQACELIVMDWLMPGMNGLEAAEKIKTEMCVEQPPHIVMVSAFAVGDVMNKAGRKYVDGFLSKPVCPSDLYDAIIGAYGITSDRRARKHRLGKHIDAETLRPIQGADILVVEDNEINQQVARELLEQAGFRVDIANHGQEAIDKLQIKPYDCVLMDVRMPVMDGFTACGKIRQDKRFEDLPVLAMTANATVEDREQSIEAGMNDHITKPIDPKVLFKALLKWIPHGEREVPESARQEEPQVALPQMPGIDTQAGIERVGGKIRSYLKLLGMFAQNQSAAIAEITAAHNSEDNEKTVRLAHTLKGVSGNIGAKALQQLAAELETALNQGPAELPADLMARTEQEVTRVCELISKLTPDADAAKAQVVVPLPDDFEQQLQTLKEKLEEYDSEAVDVLDTILVQAVGHSVHQSLMDLHKSITKFDFDAAVQQIEPIIEQHCQI